MKRAFVFAGASAMCLAAMTAPGAADQSGLAGMHDQQVVNGRLCFSGHTHVGTGSPAASKKQAVASAAQDWSSFTSFEYGSSWGSWHLAVAKKVICEPSGSNWSCEVQARPCLAGRKFRHRQVRR